QQVCPKETIEVQGRVICFRDKFINFGLASAECLSGSFRLQIESLDVQFGLDYFVAQRLVEMGFQPLEQPPDDCGAHGGMELCGVHPFDWRVVAFAMVDQRPQAIDIESEGTDGVTIDLHNHPHLRLSFFFVVVGLWHRYSSTLASSRHQQYACC